jgi:hypothetical protein
MLAIRRKRSKHTIDRKKELIKPPDYCLGKRDLEEKHN